MLRHLVRVPLLSGPSWRTVFVAASRSSSSSHTAAAVAQEATINSGSNNNKPSLDVRELKHPSKVPQKPHISSIDRQQRLAGASARVEVDDQTVQLLERLSLVDLDSREAHKTLEDSIEFASRILAIDTEGVEPLYTVLENERLTLRDDVVSDGNIQDQVLANARVTEEEYFVAPPGNIPLEQESSGGKYKD